MEFVGRREMVKLVIETSLAVGTEAFDLEMVEVYRG